MSHWSFVTQAVTRVTCPQPGLGHVTTSSISADLHVTLAKLQPIDASETVSQGGAETRDLVILIINLLLKSTHSEIGRRFVR